MSLSSSHGYTIFLSCFKLFYQRIFQFGSKRKVTYKKIECIGLIPDRGRRTGVRRCCSELADLAGGHVTWPRLGLGPALSCVVPVSFFSEFRDFCELISFCHHGVSSPHLLPIYLLAQ
jgi:hypothetical protein